MNDQHRLTDLAAFARRLADAARGETLRGWQEAGSAKNKADDAYDPVTESDIAAEKAMRRLIEEAYPEHGIVGEELPDKETASGISWVLDPIDGTRSFICGLPTWVTLIGLVQNGEPVLGLIDVPRLDERYVGSSASATLTIGGRESPLTTSGCRSLKDARFSTTDPYLFSGPEAEPFGRLRAEARVTRYGHDGYAYARVAAGSLDLVVETGLKPYDVCALVPVLRGAGGVIGNWEGGTDLSGGRIVAAATAELFDEAVGILSR